ncbi:MAG: DNA primase [Sphingomonas sp.]
MPLSIAFLDELRARTTLSALIARTVKLKRAGGEHKGRCPFHEEKTASFTVSDEKGFYHCFGCQAHGDAIRWLTDARGMTFIDAVKELAAAAGLEVPAPSPAAAERAEKAADLSNILEQAAAWYAARLEEDDKALALLERRGIDAATRARFGIGLAPAKRSVSGCGAAPAALEAAGLLIEERDGYRDRFRGRLMIPIHDPRGRIVAFAGRATGDVEPKYLNSPESAAFDKGGLLFNLHRAAPAARQARRLIIVEGQFDAIALDRIGIEEVVAPQGSALTERQLIRAWRTAHAPVLLFDGDAAGRKAALKAAERAMPGIGPGATLTIATMPEGEDPDSLARSGGAAAIEAAIAAARPLAEWLWETLYRELGAEPTPEARSRLWKRLQALAGAIGEAETRAQYLAEWRSRYDAAFPPAPPGLTDQDMLPDGSIADLSQVGEAARGRLRSVAAAWLGRARERWAAFAWAVTPEQAGRDCWEIGRRTGAGLIDEADAQAAINALQGEMLKRHPTAEPRRLADSVDYGRRRAGSLLAAMLIDMRCAAFNRTDKGNSDRWLARFGEDYLYTTAKGWLGWDQRRYRVLNQEKDTTPAEVLASVVAMVQAINREADFVRDSGWPEHEEIKPDLLAELEGDPRRPGGLDRLLHDGKKAMRLSEKLRAWALQSETAGRINCVPGLAKRAVTVELDTFDTDPMLLNCLNGTLRFLPPDEDGPARVALQPHDRADRLTKITACAYDERARAPLFVKLIKWAQPDDARRRYLRQWMGYGLTGDMGEQIFQIWYGPLAANGKSTFGNACREAAGDYGDTTNVETFLDEGPKKHGDAATPAIVRLPGVRMLTAGEPPKGAKINEPLINSVTGGDPMLARDNFRSFFRFLPIFKFTLWCNDLPSIPQGTAGIWRRVKVVPWEQHLTAEERDRDLPAKLRAEYPGILNWMVYGAIDWMQNGFVEPESVQLASADYKQDSDPLSTFLKVCTRADPEARVQGSDLYATFCAWAKAAGEVEWKPKGFAQALKAKGMAHKHSNGTHWLGIELVRHAGDFIDEEGRVKRLGGMTEDEPAPRPPPGEPVPGWGDEPP